MNLYGSNLFFGMMFVALFVLQFLWLRIPGKQGGAKNLSQNQKALDLAFCICTAFAAASLLRLYPGNARPPIQDSSAFLYIGKRMAEGKLPYRDLFDHKGPLLYLIQRVGIGLTPGSYIGVWILELVSMMISAWYMQKLAGLVTENRRDAYLAVLAVLGACGWMVWQGGNFTEEFALPWIACAAYICCSFFKSGTYRAPDVFLLGASFAAVVLLRANMVAVWACHIPIVVILLVKEKRFSDLGRCILVFLSGVLLLTIPFVIWAARAGFLRELWEDYILFNFRYTGSVSVSTADRIRLILLFAKVLWPASVALLISLALMPHRKLLWYNLLFFAVSVVSAAMSGRLYYHYAIVILPAAVLPFACCFDRSSLLLRKKKWNAAVNPAVLLVSLALMVAGAVSYRVVFSYTEGDDPLTAYLKENTKAEDNVLIVGNSCWYYLLADRKTENRYFYQLPPMEISANLRDDFYEELRQNPADCIALPGYREDRDRVDDALGGLRSFLEAEGGYQRENYDDFEVYFESSIK